ncbi:unnamed protein product [Rotaria socialis]|uniref:Uncharacterized protein n=2 Tax=Rotaria socialis TaxID=392032 RepID=A0A820CDR0_9BILA|nr:unnamed protein product [Rotaria socialis]CAF4220782.1 unnamed protein product [Rotaria socialis]
MMKFDHITIEIIRDFSIDLMDRKSSRFQAIFRLIDRRSASNELRTNALSSVRYVEVCLPSCHDGYNKANHIGKHLVPFLSTYMPRLQTLRLWRSDDFLWTSSKFILSKQN